MAKGGLQCPGGDSSRGSLLGLAAGGYGPRILDTRPSDHRGGAPDGQSARSPNPGSDWCRARGSRLRLDRASPRGHRPLRSRVPRAPGNDKVPAGLPVVVAAAAAAAAGAAAAAAALEEGRGPPGSASLPAPGRPGQRRRRLLLRLLPTPPRLMPGTGRWCPGATPLPRGACASMPGGARHCALPPAWAPTALRAGPAPGSPPPPRTGAAPPLARPALATCARGPRAPLALLAPRTQGRPVRPREIAHLRPRSCAPGPRPGPGRPRRPSAAGPRPASPPRLLLSPRPRAQPRAPSPPRRAGELCRAAAAAHYHRPARAAAALKWRRQPHRRRWAPPPALFAVML